MALVCNPTTGQVSPQYHVVFDKDFATVPYMEVGTLLPNWQELIENSSEMATTEDVSKENTWLSDQKIMDTTDELTGPFAIVPDQHKRQPIQRRAANKSNPITEHAVSSEIVFHTVNHLYTVTLQAMLQLTCLISLDETILVEQGPLKTLAAPTG